jgi:hypothetical protein
VWIRPFPHTSTLLLLLSQNYGEGNPNVRISGVIRT